jgi:nicotinamidase-related amidase
MGSTVPRGHSPGVLVVDFNRGSADPTTAHGMDLDDEIAATSRLLAAARERGTPIVFTTIAFEPSFTDAAIWLTKLPSLRAFRLGSPECEIDPRLDRRPAEPILVKKGASPFFGTNLGAILVSQGVDTVILTGSTTSGCIRAAAIDLCQNGYPAVVPRECVGDRARAPHEANLFDIHAKYADVVSLEDVLAYLRGCAGRTAEST